jgi:cellobiose phosphorylase
MKPELNIEKSGKFKVENVDRLSYLYFPLTNFHSLKSAITPSLNGDAKIDQNSFVLAPTSSEDLMHSYYNRNLYFRLNDEITWSITGNTPYQMLNKDKVDLEADFLTHKVIRTNKYFKCEIESIVPFNDTYQELHKNIVTNTSTKSIKLKPVINIPLYSRSADNIRDHRHVTSLLNKVEILENGVINKPTFSFDERGHNINNLNYGVFVNRDDICKYWPILEEFVGEGGSLLDPVVVKEDTDNIYQVNEIITGGEVCGGFEFESIILKPNESYEIIISIIVDKDRERIIKETKSLSSSYFDNLKQLTIDKWQKELSTLSFDFKDEKLNGWVKWVTLQPILRRIYGCSFLPHHDYGRGGRGWRDLWQDLLALILMNPTQVRELLLNNYAGVRIDGSNATIIGENPGEFLADRNNIARVWMDHGSWPLLTTLLYINNSGDYQLLLEKQAYFNDKFSHYTKKVKKDYESSDNYLHDFNDNKYQGTVLEHLIIQNLIPFFNIGDHNNIRIEDADWNDALDMAEAKGESVAFTSLYGYNLISLGKIVSRLPDYGINSVELLEELSILIDFDNYIDTNSRKDLLMEYFAKVEKNISGAIKEYNTSLLSSKLINKGQVLLDQVRTNEWMQLNNEGWFNGYYDGDGYRLESIEDKHMTLTGQVFAIFSGAATKSQIETIIESADNYLYDINVGGYRLNTDFQEIKLNMGRLFGFAYGHKENGAMFSHMAVMYANALYKRGFVKAGYKVLNGIYKHCIDINKSKIYPGIPEYIDPNGRGMYHYLTGSASWYILTLVTEVFGVKFDIGQLILEPKLLLDEFSKEGTAKISTLIQDNLVEIRYNNEEMLDFGQYEIDTVFIDGEKLEFERTQYGVRINKKLIGNNIEVNLKARNAS